MVDTSWWNRGTYHDREQNAVIDHLHARLSAQTSRNRQQADEARRNTQRVAGDLAGLAARVDDFIEYTDLRFDLLKYSDIADVRAQVERRFQALARGETLAVPERGDIAGYWMPPAARSVLATLSDRDSAADDSGLDTARSRDRIRAELFALSAGICFEREALSRPAAEALLRLPLSLNDSDDEPAEDPKVSRAWSLLWTRAARGELGEAGRDILRQRLTPFVATGVQPWLHAFSRRWQPYMALAELRSRCEAALSSEPGTQAGAPDIDHWRSFLQELVGGHERPILTRIAEIRHNGGDFDARPVWQRPIGTVAEVVRDDLLGDEEVDLSRRRLALSLCAPDLIAVADRLREEAVHPSAASKTFREAGRSVTVTVDGADLSEIEARLAAQYLEPGDGERRVPVMVAVVAAAAAVGFGIAGSMLAIFAVVAGVIAAGNAYRVHGNAKLVREQRDHAMAKVKTRVRREQDELVKLQSRAAQHAEAARRDHAAVIALIAADSKPRP